MSEQLIKAVEILERQRAPLLREITHNEGRARLIAPQLYYVNLLLLQLKEEIAGLKPKGVSSAPVAVSKPVVADTPVVTDEPAKRGVGRPPNKTS